jgi:hypothetical protein
MQKSDVERYLLKKLNKVKNKEQYLVKISNRLKALENFDGDDIISRPWGSIGENNKISAKECLCCYELKQLKPWFDECSQLLNQMKQVRLLWL